jgi:hypothetical protein
MAVHQPTADRPRTGTMTMALIAAHTARKTSADLHDWRWIEANTGSVDADTVPSCHPDSPRNHPTFARGWSS